MRLCVHFWIKGYIKVQNNAYRKTWEYILAWYNDKKKKINVGNLIFIRIYDI